MNRLHRKMGRAVCGMGVVVCGAGFGKRNFNHKPHILGCVVCGLWFGKYDFAVPNH